MLKKEINNYPRKRNGKQYDVLRINIQKKDNLQEGSIYLATEEEYKEIEKLKKQAENPTGIPLKEKEKYENEIADLHEKITKMETEKQNLADENRKLIQDMETIKKENSTEEIENVKLNLQEEIQKLNEKYDEITQEHIQKLNELKHEFEKNDQLHHEKEELLNKINNIEKKYTDEKNILIRMLETLMNQIENQSFFDRLFRKGKIDEEIEENRTKLLTYKENEVKETYRVYERQ